MIKKNTIYSIIVLLLMLMIGNGILFLKINKLNNENKMEQIDYSLSKAYSVKGIFVYTDSKPNQEYKELGLLTITFSLNEQYDNIKNNFVEQCLEKYPDADGLILDLKNGETDKAIVIKFIEE